MIDKNKLRGSDLITGGIFAALGVLIIILALQMPLTDSFGGVQSQWYVSPALLPLIIGACMILISIAIIVHALKNGGFQQLKEIIAEKKGEPILNIRNMRMAAVIIPLCTIVYVHLKAFDFFFSVAIYLIFTISVFYFEDDDFLRKSVYWYTALCVAMIIIMATKLNKVVNGLFFASMDVIGLAILTFFTVRTIRFAKHSDNPIVKKRLKHVLLVSFLVPLFIIPIFRYALRVPMPQEGVIINIMSRIYYALR